tara:strand:- start:258 stop:362 length:105 start_codon:yes stop_codon:yes gene_type:complete
MNEKQKKMLARMKKIKNMLQKKHAKTHDFFTSKK